MATNIQEKLFGTNKSFVGGPYIDLYDDEPKEELSINDVIDLAYYRSKFHKEFDEIENGQDKNDRIKALCNKYGIPIEKSLLSIDWSKNAIPNVPQLEKPSNTKEYYDKMSFYSYLLVSLRTDESQRKFVQIESKLFRFRFRNLLSQLGSSTFTHLLKPLCDLIKFNIDDYYMKDTKEYKIPFYEIFPFINVTYCRLENGSVFVKPSELDSFFANLYTIYLNRKFASIRAKKIHESSLVKVLVHLFDEKSGNFQIEKRSDYSRVNLDEMNKVVRSFPPCMFFMNKKLNENHKLKYHGRLQFGLFIKGIGLTMDESLKFWREKFCHIMSNDEFDKMYAYNIRYNYGKEGSCKNRSPYTCSGIIRAGAPAAGEAHGCPFKYMSPPQLEDLMKLINPQITQSTMNIILEKARMNPGIACATCFNGLHPKHEFDETGVSHPNVYFSESEERFREEEKDASAEPQE